MKEKKKVAKKTGDLIQRINIHLLTLGISSDAAVK